MFVSKAERQERKENVRFLKEVLSVLNRSSTSVIKHDDTYVVNHDGDKRYEITFTNIDTIIRAFDGDMPEDLHVVFKEGANVKAKSWLLKYQLQSETEPTLVEMFASKMKSVKAHIDLTNDFLTILDLPGTKVNVLHETTVMKKYEIGYNQSGKLSRKTIEFDGSVIKIDDTNNFEKYGYMAWKWGFVRRQLDKNIAKAMRQH